MVVPLLAAPTMMLAVSAVERRAGPGAAGVVAAAPLSIAVIVFALGAEGPAVAAAAGAHVVAQVAFALAFAVMVVRRGPFTGFGAASVAYLAVSQLLTLIPAWLATALAVPVLAAASSADIRAAPASSGRPVDPRVGAVIVFGIVGASLLAADLSGPVLAGTVAAFPTLSGTFALLLARARGTQAAAHALRGLILGLRGYLAFCVVVAATGSVALGLAAAIAVTSLPRQTGSTATSSAPATGLSLVPVILRSRISRRRDSRESA